MLRSSLIILLLVAVASAFSPSAPPSWKTSAPVASSTARFIVLSDEETEAILNSAKDCADGECSVDEVGDLVSELKDQQSAMEERLKKINGMISKLEDLNEKKERSKDEIKAFVKDMLRVFAHEKTGFNAVGFSGDIGDGPQTAYDALPPKPWKANK